MNNARHSLLALLCSVTLIASGCGNATDDSIEDAAAAGNETEGTITSKQGLTGIFTIRPRHSLKCLAISQGRLTNGTPLIQWDCANVFEQQFQFDDLGYGFHAIRAVHSNKCLAIGAASTANGANVIQWDCVGSIEQQFSVQKTAEGYYQIVARHSSKCLGVSGSSRSNGAEVIQWACSGGADQQFLMQ